jgi:hypothetical protein
MPRGLPHQGRVPAPALFVRFACDRMQVASLGSGKTADAPPKEEGRKYLVLLVASAKAQKRRIEQLSAYPVGLSLHSLTNHRPVISNRDQAIWASLGVLGHMNDFRMDVMASVE